MRPAPRKSKSEKSLVSVIIPTFNRQDYLGDALSSVWSQDYRPLECIVVDDGSTDDTEGIVAQWTSETCRDSDFYLRYLYQENRGAQVARNEGVEAARGAFIQFLDSDDALVAGKTRQGVEVLRANPDADLVYFKTVKTDEHLNPVEGATIGHSSRSWAEDVAGYLWHTSGPLYRRDAIERIGPWLETLDANQDWEYGSRARLLGVASIFVPEVGSLNRDHQSDRIGASGFDFSFDSYDEAYNRSVERSYDHIVGLAQELDLRTPLLSEKMARKYLMRALINERSGNREACWRCLGKAADLSSQLSVVRGMSNALLSMHSESAVRAVSYAVAMRGRLQQQLDAWRK